MSEGKPPKTAPATLARRAWLIGLSVTIVPILTALLLRTFVIEAFKVPAGSMIPTLRIGDHMFVRKGSAVARRGEVFVFKFPENPAQAFVKRVVATSGDELEVLDGRPVVNGTLAPRCYVGPFQSDQQTFHLYLERLDARIYGVVQAERAPETKCSTAADCTEGRSCAHAICVRDILGPYEARSGEAWVLGDNRDNSFDSPRWDGGRGRGVSPDLAIGTGSEIFMGGLPGRFWTSSQGLPTLDEANSALQADVDRCAGQLAR